MYSTLAFQEAVITERRHRYEVAATKHRFLSGLRHRVSAHRASAPVPARDRLTVAPTPTPLGRTPSGAGQRAA